MTYIKKLLLSFLLITLFCPTTRAAAVAGVDVEEAIKSFASKVREYKESPSSELALQIRQYEPLIAEKEDIDPWLLWVEGTPDLKVITVNSDNLDEIIAGYGDPPEDILSDIKAGGSHLIRMNANSPPRFRRLPSQYVGGKFLIGGERGIEKDKLEIYTLNFDNDFYPDIFGQAEDVAALVAIPDAKFTDIEFDWIDHGIFEEDVIKKYIRILKPPGNLLIKTNRNTKAHYEEKSIASEIEAICTTCKKLGLKCKSSSLTNDAGWQTPEESFFYKLMFEKLVS